MSGAGRPWIFRCDGGATLGLGHIHRCLALMEAFDERGASVILATRFPREVPADNPFPVHALRHADTRKKASAELACLANSSNARGIVFDHYEIDHMFLRRIKTGTRQGLKLAYVGNSLTAVEELDLVIRQQLTPREVMNEGVVAGPEYLLVRKSFSNLPRRHVNAGVERILVTLGGSETSYFRTVLRALNRSFGPSPLNIYVIGRNVKMDWLSDSTNNFISLGLVDDMAALLDQVDLAITAAGTTLYQMAASGLPAIALAIVDNQVQQALDFAQKGVVHFLGTGESVTEGNVCQAVRDMIQDQDRRRQMSKRGQDLVDGRGAHRCAERLLAIV